MSLQEVWRKVATGIFPCLSNFRILYNISCLFTFRSFLMLWRIPEYSSKTWVFSNHPSRAQLSASFVYVFLGCLKFSVAKVLLVSLNSFLDYTVSQPYSCSADVGRYLDSSAARCAAVQIWMAVRCQVLNPASALASIWPLYMFTVYSPLDAIE